MNENDRDHRDHSDDDSRYMYRDPVERFGQLPESTRKWLEDLRKEDIKEINNALKLYRRVNAGGWLLKYTLGTIVVFFVGAAALGESLQKVWGWIIHLVRQ